MADRITFLIDGASLKPVRFEDLRKDDHFQLQEPDGALIGDFIAQTDAYQNEGEWTIACRRVG